ncbi:MAG: nickel ABC transporter permease [Acidobacteriota bacterium]
MIRFVLKRSLSTIIMLLGVSTITFLLIHLVPGDPAHAILRENAQIQDVENLRRKMGLNLPLSVQYKNFILGIFKRNMGKSLITGKNVSDEIKDHFPATLELALGSLLISIIISLPFGVLSAYKEGSIIDHVSTGFSIFGLAIPNFWLGPLLIILFSIKLRLFPVSGRDGLLSLILPATTLGTYFSAFLMRITKVSILEELNENWVRTARAKGLKESQVMIKHVLRNSLIPIVTILGLQAGSLLTGAIITETIFSWPGIGSLLIKSITRRDYPMVQGVVLFISFLYIFINFLTDILYSIIDPRIRVKGV